MNDKQRSFRTSLILLMAFSLLITGCSLRIGYKSSSSSSKMNASFFFLSETRKKSLSLRDGDTLIIDYEIRLEQGLLRAKVEDPLGHELMTLEPNTQGVREITIQEDGVYKIVIQAEKAKGSYKIQWRVE